MPLSTESRPDLDAFRIDMSADVSKVTDDPSARARPCADPPQAATECLRELRGGLDDPTWGV